MMNDEAKPESALEQSLSQSPCGGHIGTINLAGFHETPLAGWHGQGRVGRTWPCSWRIP